MSLCLVTGGAGFIGSHLVEALLGQGYAVRVLDNFSSGNPANLDNVIPDVELVQGDVADLDTVRAAVAGAELVFHLAGQPSVARSVIDPQPAHHACASGTLHVLLAARETGVRRVIYAASSSAYGNSDKLPHHESDPARPVSPYAVAKLAGEHYCETFSRIYGLETVRLRYFNVFGPRQSADNPHAAAVPLFMRAMLAGRSPVVYGDGLQTRDFTYVDDVIQANLLAIEARRVAGKVYNIAFGRRTTLLELLDCLNDILGTHIRPIHNSPRSGDARHCWADTAQAQTELGFCPCVDLVQGLERSVDWWLAGQRGVDGPGGAPHARFLLRPHRAVGLPRAEPARTNGR
jgi:UDP-glucose 4-epimerase